LKKIYTCWKFCCWKAGAPTLILASISSAGPDPLAETSGTDDDEAGGGFPFGSPKSMALLCLPVASLLLALLLLMPEEAALLLRPATLYC
jgi:hypothetical protein